MELVLEIDEVEELLREALKNQGLVVPENFQMIHRVNNKKRTFRIVFQPKPRRGLRPK